MIHVISLGAGVQSSVLALMAAAGEIGPMPEAAIFADTMAEPASVYKWLDWLETQLPFPVIRVSAGSLEEDVLRMRTTKDGRKYSRTNLPMFTRNADGSEGKIRFRSCTSDFKIKPIRKAQRTLAGIKRGQKTVGVITWIGISLDEATRMKPSRDPWCENRWPLIEMRITRQDCLKWMQEKGYPEPPRSSCTFCPFHNNVEWTRLRDQEPDEFAKAVEFEKAVQIAKSTSNNFRSTPFLHRDLVPLDQVDFRSRHERNGQINLFENECEGVCGV
jgi:hypothetical protein